MKNNKSATLVANRKAQHNYQIIDTLEVGIALTASEVKSCIAKNVSIGESYCQIKNGELFLLNCNIARYDNARLENCDPLRVRKLLAHKSELRRLKKCVESKGMALVPIDMHICPSRKIKLILGVCRGKNAIDKRRAISEREQKIEIKRLVK